MSPLPSRAWVTSLVLLLPWIYLGVAARLSEGLHQQPHLVLAGSRGRLAHELVEAGGVESVRSGLVLDFVFVFAFVAVTATVLSRDSGRWWLPVIPASLDVAENVLVAVLLDRDVTEDLADVLYAVAVSKFAAYLIVGGSVLVHLFGRRSRI